MPTDFATEIQNPKIKGHFYRIEDADGKVLGYLLGTIHMMHGCIIGMNEEIRSAISQANRLFLEIKELDLAVAHMEKKTELLLESQQEEKLKEALQAYTHILKAHPQCLNGMTWEELERTLAQLPLIDALKLCFRHYDYVCEYKKGTLDSTGAKIPVGIDGWLFHQFSHSGKPIHGLESAEQQFQLADELSASSKGEEIMGMLEPNLDEVEQAASQWSKRWAGGDIPKLPHHQPGTLGYRLREERSEQFGKNIYKDLMENGQRTGFYGFGMAHLYDSAGGVIKVLQERGLKVIRE